MAGVGDFGVGQRMKILRLLLALLLSLGAVPARAETPWQVVKTYPHDRTAFTEGLFFLDGILYESTGQPGASDIRKVRLKDGKVMAKAKLPPQYFGEGIVNWGDELLSLTWQHQIGFRWARSTLRQTASFTYEGEGWALTQAGTRIIMSDGTPVLRLLDPATMAQMGSLPVTWRGKPVPMLNELEYVKGEILANIWMTNLLARIDPATGNITDWIDLTPLVEKNRGGDPNAVLNGIAYDARNDRLFVTGKYWPKLYEIRLKR